MKPYAFQNLKIKKNRLNLALHLTLPAASRQQLT
jgi:hypothetical protein